MKTLQERTFDLLEGTQTNWSVNKKPLLSEDQESTGSYGLFRNDSGIWLGTVGERYQVLQNFELAETIIEASNELSLDFSGGILQGGQKVFYHAKLKDEYIGSDIIKRNLTALNSHDGSSSVGFGFSNTVVVCTNTFYKAMKEVQKFRHTMSMRDRINLAMVEMQKVLTAENETIENFKVMSETKVTKKAIELIVSDLFKLNDGDMNTYLKDVGVRKVNDMREFSNVMQSEFASHGETLWGLFNAVTWKTNHIDSKRGKVLDNVMVGSGYEKNLKAYNRLVELINE